MTKNEIKKMIKARIETDGDRIVDWDFDECMEEIVVRVIIVTTYHSVYRGVFFLFNDGVVDSFEINYLS